MLATAIMTMMPSAVTLLVILMNNSSKELQTILLGQCQAGILITVWPHVTTTAKAEAPYFSSIYEAILATAQPNHLVAKIQVTSGLNLDAWDEVLSDYHDSDICKYLRYGWPLGYHKSSPPVSTSKNHPSAEQHLSHVKNFIATELSHDAILGPFSEPLFAPWFRCSPIMTRPKKGTPERRVIVDLSFPEGQGVNDGIDNSDYFGANITYTLPSLGDLITRLQEVGPGALVWKADLARAYRQLRVDPVDAPLLGIKVEGKYYVDLCPPFGCKTSSAACQRVSNAMIYLLRMQGFFGLAYLNDYGGCEANDILADRSYNTFMQLAQQLGLQLAQRKCVPPCTNIEWLGYNIDTVAMLVKIPELKMQKVLAECERWATKDKATWKMVQSLAGRLLYLTNYVKLAYRKISGSQSPQVSSWT